MISTPDFNHLWIHDSEKLTLDKIKPMDSILRMVFFNPPCPYEALKNKSKISFAATFAELFTKRFFHVNKSVRKSFFYQFMKNHSLTLLVCLQFKNLTSYSATIKNEIHTIPLNTISTFYWIVYNCGCLLGLALQKFKYEKMHCCQILDKILDDKSWR